MLSKSAMESCRFRERELVPSIKAGRQLGITVLVIFERVVVALKGFWTWIPKS